MTGTLPIPWFMDAFVAPVELQVRVEGLPLKIVAGEAENVTVGLAAQISETNPPKAITTNISVEIFLRIIILLESVEIYFGSLACLINALAHSLRIHFEKYALQLLCQPKCKCAKLIRTMITGRITKNDKYILCSALSQFGKVK